MNFQIVQLSDKLIKEIQEKGSYTPEQTLNLISAIREKTQLNEAEKDFYDSQDILEGRLSISFNNEDDIDRAWDFVYQICKDLNLLLDNQSMTFNEVVTWVETQELKVKPYSLSDLSNTIKKIIAQRVIELQFDRLYTVFELLDTVETISTRKTFHLWENSDNTEISFEVEPNGVVKKIWPTLEVTNLTEADLQKWLAEDLASGRNSVCREVITKSNSNVE
jgi:hypothetical protein